MKFSELYINSEGNLLVIEVQCDESESIYPKEINIDNQDTYVEGKSSDSPVYTSINHTESKTFRLEIPADTTIDISDNLFFVYCKASDNSMIMCPVCDLYRIYQSFMPAIKSIGTSCCCLPKNFIDCILRFKAVELSIKAGNYLQAIQYWNKFFTDDNLKKVFSNGCCK